MIAEFVSCALLAFMAPLIIFSRMVLADDPIRIIIMLLSALAWWVSYYLSYAVEPLLPHHEFWIVYGVLFQELFRVGGYFVLHRMVILEHQYVVSNKYKMQLAYVAGLGTGLACGAHTLDFIVSYSTNLEIVALVNSTDNFFVKFAGLTVCMIILHIFGSVVFFSGFDEKSYLKVMWVIVSDVLYTVLNGPEMHVCTSALILIGTIFLAFQCAGFSFRSFMQSLKTQSQILY